MWLEHAHGSCPAQVRDGEQLAQARFAKRIETNFATATCMRPADIARLTCENLYENAAPGVSVRYTLYSDFMKADIILAASSALENAALHLPDDFAYTLEEENALRIADKESGDAPFKGIFQAQGGPFKTEQTGKAIIQRHGDCSGIADGPEILFFVSICRHV